MSEDNSVDTEPSALDATDASIYAKQVAPRQRQKPSTAMWLGLGMLVILALAVVFVLPSVVSEYELPLERRVEEVSQSTAAVSQVPETTVSPFEEAQRSIQRKESQDVLAELLELQGQLDLLEVEAWGQEDYESALATAAIGDEYYRTQDFVLATESYGNGREALAELIESVPNVLTQLLIDAENALTASDTQTAQDKYSLALVLESDNEAAQIGLARAQVLDEVLATLDEADDLFEDGELVAARELYEQVVSLDSYNETAPQRISEIDVQIQENEFSAIMSEGYALLQANDPQQAIATFQRAAAMGINQQQAQAAIQQTETQVANAEINGLQQEITAAEASERWQDAVDAYDKVLAIDANLLFAMQGRELANQRATLNQLLVNAIEAPERLSEDAVYEENLRYYFIGRDIENPGPVLRAQLDELQVLLENSQVPIDINFVSDLFTDVTLLKIGALGKFEQTSLALKPGNYVAVGRRPGFRDVREEFTVGFGQTPDSVVVQCVERVVATNR